MGLAFLQRNTILQNRYAIVSPIGNGDRSDVYLAIDQQFGSKVALKRILLKGDEKERVEQEARVLATLRHPNLAKLTDHFDEGNYKYLVMEYVEGDNLEKIVERRGAGFTLDWVLYWADQLLEALNYLHSQRPPIFHRDIKPQNLKLTAENNVMLVDVGLERIVGSAGDENGRKYEAIEQIRGSGVNERSEIYSLSGTLYYLLTGQTPVDAVTRANYVLNNMADPLKALHEVSNEVPEEISKVIMKGLSIAANLRYGSAREMQKALREGYLKYKSGLGKKDVVARVEKTEEKTLVIEGSREQKMSMLEQEPQGEKTLVLEERVLTAEIEKKGESVGRDEEVALSKTSRKTEISPEEIFPEVIPSEGYADKNIAEKNEVTVPLIKFEAAEETSNYRIKFGDEEELLNRDVEERLEVGEYARSSTDIRQEEARDYEGTSWERNLGGVTEEVFTETQKSDERMNIGREAERASQRRNSNLIIVLPVLLILFLGVVVAVGVGVYVMRDRVFGGGKTNVTKQNETRPIVEDPKLRNESTQGTIESQDRTNVSVNNVNTKVTQENSNVGDMSTNTTREDITADTNTRTQRLRDKDNDLERPSATGKENNRQQKSQKRKEEEKKPTPARTPDILQ